MNSSADRGIGIKGWLAGQKPKVKSSDSNIKQIALDRHRIAVLPFSNFSPDPRDEYFADGMTEEIISKISRISGLSVISRTSTMSYKGTPKKVKEIGRELEVGSILEGSLRKAGNRIRVTAQLVDVALDQHLWSQSYDRELQDVFEIQADIAMRVAESTEVSLLDGERYRIERIPTKNMSAYESYLRGIQVLQKDPGYIPDYIRHLEEAIAQDPNFALAYAALGDLYVSMLGDFIPPRAAFEKADPLITKALDLDENSSDAHLAKGNLALQYHLDYELAEREIKRAIDLNPSNAAAHMRYATLAVVTGDFEGALREAKVSHELDPLSVITETILTLILFAKRDFAEAITITEKTIDLEPESPFSHLLRAFLLSRVGRLEEARLEVDVVQKLRLTIMHRIYLANALAEVGQRDAARRLLIECEAARQKEYFSLTDLAFAYLSLGETERALRLLEEGFEESPSSFAFRYRMPLFDQVRDNTRFVVLQSRLNLPKR